MPSVASRRFIWALAAVLLLAVGFVLLRACDLEIFPLYGHRYCAAPRSEALAAERSRNAAMQAELRQAELTLAQKPKCAQPQPLPLPLPQPQPHPLDPEKLKVPKKLSELRGCWESVRGDISIVSDDAEQRPIGKVRECYCFGGNGRGIIKLLYTNGVKCRAPIMARLDSDKLRMAYPKFSCLFVGKDWGLVPADITCENGDDPNGATCTTYGHGQTRSVTTEQYRRVEQDHCGN
ncbi:hypothetical protein [Methylocapsa acidiphila]|uniref:hypothetical protein n=1 Tax=Methylocapsa acidiphila TaxID=133552 RepID=UPI0012ECADA8|nr:hypothetical protein [Methylocapsa acidiphila]